MQVQDGYPIDYVTDYYQALCVPWDPATRLPLQNTSDIYPTPGATISLGGNNFQFQFNYVNFGISVGNYITVGHLVTRCPFSTSATPCGFRIRPVCHARAAHMVQS